MKTYISFLASLAFTFVLLSYMWVSAAHADTRCTELANGVTMCDGAGFQLPEAPRGTVKHRPAVSVAHRVRAALVVARAAQAGRVGTTVVVARYGVRL